MDRIALRLKALRKLCSLSQKELAEMAGISVTTINNIEKGRDTSLSTIQKLEKVLDAKLY